MRTIKVKLMAFVAAFAIAASTAIAAPVGQGSDGLYLMNKVRKELVTLPYYGVFDNLAEHAQQRREAHKEDRRRRARGQSDRGVAALYVRRFNSRSRLSGGLPLGQLVSLCDGGESFDTHHRQSRPHNA
jgi:hypothetical protein